MTYPLIAIRIDGFYHGEVEGRERAKSAGVTRFMEWGNGRLEHDLCRSPPYYV